ncbi:MAG: PhnD/SsuA/transferrin family substrate-binding protein [Rhodospirillales bacterium]|jgi:phosphonate transport system substrate-binding protein
MILRGLVASLAFAIAGLNAAHGETLTFAPLPMETPETVVKQVKPMLTYLQKDLGVSIKIDYSSDYAEILAKFESGALDLAYLGPLPYLTLRDRVAAATPLVHFKEASGSATYTCAIVAPADAKPDLARLKGRKVALTQPLSTCGYLSTDGLLRQAGSSLEDNQYRYLDKHDEVALAVTRGEFDLGGLKTAIGKKYAHMGLVVVAESGPLPGFALVANAKTVSKERMAQLRDALVAVDAETAKGWGDNIRRGSVAAFDGDYDGLRRLRRKAIIPNNGNF